MNKVLSLKYCLDTLSAAIAVTAGIAVLQSFAIGRHYIIPTGFLVFAVLFGNLAHYGYRDHAWAKRTNFWITFLFACHGFFALFWSKRYREILGAAFEYVAAGVVLLLIMLLVQYARRNDLFR